MDLIAADRLRISVFELYDRPLCWRARALVARNAEVYGENEQRRRAAQKNKMGLG